MRTRTALTFGTLAMLLIALGVLIVVTRSERENAEAFLRQVRSVKVGVTDFNHVVELARRFQAHSSILPGCNSTRCEITFEFNNSILAKIRLSRFTFLGSSIKINSGFVSYVGVVYRVETKTPLASSVTIIELPESPGFHDIEIHRVAADTGRPPFVVIKTTPSVMEEYRSILFDFDLTCLTRFRGCSDVTELARPMWNLKGRFPEVTSYP